MTDFLDSIKAVYGTLKPTAITIDPILEEIAKTTPFSYEMIKDAYGDLKNYDLVRAACQFSSVTQTPLFLKDKHITQRLDTCDMLLMAIYGGPS